MTFHNILLLLHNTSRKMLERKDIKIYLTYKHGYCSELFTNKLNNEYSANKLASFVVFSIGHVPKMKGRGFESRVLTEML